MHWRLRGSRVLVVILGTGSNVFDHPRCRSRGPCCLCSITFLWKLCSDAQLCPALCNPVDLAHPAPLSMVFFRQEYWSGLPFPSPGDLPEPGMEPMSLASTCFSRHIPCHWHYLGSWSTDKLINWYFKSISSVQSLSHVQLFATSWTVAHQASLSITNSRSLLKLMSIESVMPSNHRILCRPLLLLRSSFPASGSFSMVSSFHQVAKVLEYIRALKV